MRKPENLSMARVEAVNRENLKKFYDNLEELQGKCQYPPHRIYIVDETGISPVVPGKEILAEKGVKRVGKVSSGEEGKTTSTVGCVNAAGDAVPPMVIFGGRKRRKTELLNGMHGRRNRGNSGGSCPPPNFETVVHGPPTFTEDFHYAFHHSCNF